MEEYTHHIPNAFFPILHASPIFILVYCRHKCIVAKLIALQIAHWIGSTVINLYYFISLHIRRIEEC
jgi:hypothetical protein